MSNVSPNRRPRVCRAGYHEHQFRGGVRLLHGCIRSHARLSVLLGVDVSSEAVTTGHHLPQLLQVRSWSLRHGVRTAWKCSQTGGCPGHRYVQRFYSETDNLKWNVVFLCAILPVKNPVLIGCVVGWSSEVWRFWEREKLLAATGNLLFVLSSNFGHTCFFVIIVLASALFRYNTHNTNIHGPGGIQNRSSSQRAVTGLRLTPREHRHQQWNSRPSTRGLVKYR